MCFCFLLVSEIRLLHRTIRKASLQASWFVSLKFGLTFQQLVPFLKFVTCGALSCANGCASLALSWGQAAAQPPPRGLPSTLTSSGES